MKIFFVGRVLNPPSPIAQQEEGNNDFVGAGLRARPLHGLKPWAGMEAGPYKCKKRNDDVCVGAGSKPAQPNRAARGKK